MASDDIHVYPVDDLIAHTISGGDCVCGPTIEPIQCDDGSYRWMLAHHSLDGRELHEARSE